MEVKCQTVPARRLGGISSITWLRATARSNSGNPSRPHLSLSALSRQHTCTAGIKRQCGSKAGKYANLCFFRCVSAITLE